MINRVTYKFRSLPTTERESDFVSYLESQPNYGELTLHANADSTGAMRAEISITIPRIYAYIYKNYFVEVIPINQQLIITCHKVTPGLLTKKYADIREKLSTLNMYLDDFDKELRLKEYNARYSSRLDLKTRFNALKREIKAELRLLGVNIKPGSPISKLLRQDNL